MTNKYIIAIAILIGGLFTGCDEGFLDRYPSDQLSDGSYWKTEEDARKYATTLYTSLPDEEIEFEIYSNNAVHGIKWAEGDVAKGVYDPLDGTFSGRWSTAYKWIHHANVLIANSEMIVDITPEAKADYIAQGKFFRAYHYFNLTNVFGGVPLITGTISLEDSYNESRTPIAEVVTQMLTDLDDASNNLPSTRSGDEVGMVTSGAANALIARIAIFFEDYQTAITASKKVIDSQVYSLFDEENTGEYAELFYSVSDGNSETVLAKRFDSGLDAGNWYNTFYAPPGWGWGGINPTQSFVDAFECIDGKTIAESDLYDDANPFENRDPRLEVTVLHHGETFGDASKTKVVGTRPVSEDAPTGVGTNGDATATGYYAEKFVSPYEDINGVDAWNSDFDWMVIRFAEVLLTYAEAENELNGPTAAVYSSVDRVRSRVGMPALPSGLSQDEMRVRIRREWLCEFGMEGRQYLNLYRWRESDGSRTAETALVGQYYGMKYDAETETAFIGENIVAGQARIFSSHNVLWPIPQSQRDIMPNLEQNPGY